MLTIPRHYLRAALHCVANKDTRQYLCGVHIELTPSGNVYIVSTTGSLLFAGHMLADGEGITPGEPWELTIPTDTVKKESKGKGVVVLQETNGVYSLGESLFKPIEERFPDWRKVIDQIGEPSQQPLQFNPELLLKAYKSVSEWQESDCFLDHHKNAARVVGCLENAFAIVAPLRVDLGSNEERKVFTPTRY